MYKKWNTLIVAAAIATPLPVFAQQSGEPVVPEQVQISYHIFHVESPAENITGVSLDREEIEAIAEEDGIKGVAKALQKEGETKLLQSGQAHGVVGSELRHTLQTEKAIAVRTPSRDERLTGPSIPSWNALQESCSGVFITRAPMGNHEISYSIDLDIMPPVEKDGEISYSRLRASVSNTTRLANAEKETIVVRTSHTLGGKPVDLIYVITAEVKPSN